MQRYGAVANSDELAATAINITCYDRNGDEGKGIRAIVNHLNETY